jgi:RimJ/RimL family protein N-acetyltransferase
MNNTVLETSRLVLKKIDTNDAPFYVKLFNSKGWLQNIGDRNIKSNDDAVAYIKKHYLPEYEKNGYGSYTVNLKETGETIGACGLYKRDVLEDPDIGFAFLDAYHGKGYGYESASAIMEYALTSLDIQTILGFTLPTNVASIKLLEKLGLKETGTFRFGDEEEELLLFSNNYKK